MKLNDITTLLIIAVADATIQQLADENKQLREHVAGYDRLRAAHGQLKGRASDLEIRIARADETARRYWTMIQNGDVEVRQLRAQVEELGRKNIALAAEAENADHWARVADQAHRRIDELEAAFQVARLSAESRDNVIRMVRAA
ncbi:hypothetical protein AAFM71_07540 [Chromobacterium violaceum]|uniref:Uncharacterized protein n=1 Tax=Chromobacterium violaceum TaxID=536 RepID=A0A202B5L8_CHRVL|nr:hypothetical protein [Chromobacterium violaceum]OVE46718.1 hypothetical protein CBW21_17640 [Chromobacterium violaceum]